MIRLPPQSINSTPHREADRRALIRLGAVFICGLVLTVGFVCAAAQRTAAVRHGYRSEELRREKAQLIAEQRRLMLALTEAQSPQQLERNARAIGLEPARSSQLDLRMDTPALHRSLSTLPVAAATSTAAVTMRRPVLAAR
jgi:hypothetical protein